MIYGLNRVLPVESAPSAQPDLHPAFAWKTLDEISRLKLVERQLKPANDLIDGFPIAL